MRRGTPPTCSPASSGTSAETRPLPKAQAHRRIFTAVRRGLTDRPNPGRHVIGTGGRDSIDQPPLVAVDVAGYAELGVVEIEVMPDRHPVEFAQQVAEKITPRIAEIS